MKLSEIAWEKANPIFQKIIAHPFFQEIANGTLDRNIYDYYLEQDYIYTKDQENFEALIASKVPHSYKEFYLINARQTLEYNQGIKLYFEESNISLTGHVTESNLGYKDFLTSTTLKAVEISIAADLPCYWYYKVMADIWANNTVPNNIYQNHIDSYSSAEYGMIVNNMINIFDDLASNSTSEMQNEMVNAFLESANYEWNFNNDVYYKKFFDNI